MTDWALECWNARKDARLTQQEMADALGVHLSTWRRWENGVTEPEYWRKEAARDTFALERYPWAVREAEGASA